MALAADGSPCSSFPFILLVLLLPLLALPIPAAAQGYRNVSLGSSLTTQGTSTSWLSPMGDFAMGFLPAISGATDFLLAVWFAKILENTAVWFLRIDPDGTIPQLRAGSRLDLTMGGLLVLTDHKNTTVWTANKDSAASYAAMLDTGNFILVSSSSKELWQSFKVPTDTILPTQELPLGTALISRLMDRDYSNGRFKLSVQRDGNLVLYPISLPNGDQYRAYWSSKTLGNGSRLIFDSSGNIYMALESGGVAINVTSGDVSTAEFYQRGTIGANGVFGHYRYPKNATVAGSRWPLNWTASKLLPEDICVDIFSDNGSGACGYNAYCTTVNQIPICRCPEGYSFVDSNRQYKGCKPDIPLQSCSVTDIDPSGYKMIQMQDVDWPLMDYEHFVGIDEDDCRLGCMKDCFCAVAIYGAERECWRKKLPLSNGKATSGQNRKALIKISTNLSVAELPQNPASSQKGKNIGISAVGFLLIGGLLLIVFILAVALSILLFCASRMRRQKLPDLSILDSKLCCFTYAELETATKGFKEEVGRGAFGIVYKGAFSDEVHIAAKKLDKSELKKQDAEKEFVTEVKAMGRTYHKNLVRLLDYCKEDSHRILVYEFMSNGSLMNLLFGAGTDQVLPKPSWALRKDIACGVARGLLYLHEECTNQIIHCDIKPQNVLLDEHLNPRISDFGMAKLLRTDQTRTATGIRGTKGYVAPEWFKLVPINPKVDVYSFGVMLLEIVCCKKVVEPVYDPDGEEVGAQILTDWAYDCYREGRLDQLVANDEEAAADIYVVERFVKVAIWCIQEEPSLRPSIKKVNQMLESTIEVCVPPDPSFSLAQ